MKIAYTAEDLKDHHAIGVIITNKQGEILVQKHVKYGFWTIPVGKVKQEQKVEEALREEMQEECNIEVRSWEEIATKTYVYERNGKNVTVPLHLFQIFSFEGIIKNNEPHNHTTQIFLPIEKIKELPYLSDATLLFLETKGIYRTKSI